MSQQIHQRKELTRCDTCWFVDVSVGLAIALNYYAQLECSVEFLFCGRVAYVRCVFSVYAAWFRQLCTLIIFHWIRNFRVRCRCVRPRFWLLFAIQLLQIEWNSMFSTRMSICWKWIRFMNVTLCIEHFLDGVSGEIERKSVCARILVKPQ